MPTSWQSLKTYLRGDHLQVAFTRRCSGIRCRRICRKLHASYPNAVESGKPSIARSSCGLSRPPRKEGVRSRDVFRIALLAVFE